MGTKVIEFDDGRRYEGEVSADGQPHGRGIMTWPEGYFGGSVNGDERYEGGWRDGEKCGQGILTMRGGFRFEGGFVEGGMFGRGKMAYPEGWCFEGNHRQWGVTRAEGCLVGFPDSDSDDVGTVTFPDGRCVQVGPGGMFPGDLAVELDDGRRYFGDLRDGKPNGFGVMSRGVNGWQAGRFVDGQPDNEGAGEAGAI